MTWETGMGSKFNLNVVICCNLASFSRSPVENCKAQFEKSLSEKGYKKLRYWKETALFQLY